MKLGAVVEAALRQVDEVLDVLGSQAGQQLKGDGTLVRLQHRHLVGRLGFHLGGSLGLLRLGGRRRRVDRCGKSQRQGREKQDSHPQLLPMIGRPVLV